MSDELRKVWFVCMYVPLCACLASWEASFILLTQKNLVGDLDHGWFLHAWCTVANNVPFAADPCARAWACKLEWKRLILPLHS